MSGIKLPGEPGYDDDTFFAHVINVGLRMAREVGIGLPLYNRLQAHFRDVAKWIIGQATQLVGQGVRAAQDWMSGGPDFIVPLEDVPTAPASFFGPEEEHRVVGITDVPGATPDSTDPVYHTTRISWPEDWTKAAIEDVTAAVMLDDEQESPGMNWQMLEQQKQHMIWIGKRF